MSTYLHIIETKITNAPTVCKPFEISATLISSYLTTCHLLPVLSYNMALIITSIKPINPSYFTIVCAHPGSPTC